jgi:hypothetical protein
MITGALKRQPEPPRYMPRSEGAALGYHDTMLGPPVPATGTPRYRRSRAWPAMTFRGAGPHCPSLHVRGGDFGQRPMPDQRSDVLSHIDFVATPRCWRARWPRSTREAGASGENTTQGEGRSPAALPLASFGLAQTVSCCPVRSSL